MRGSGPVASLPVGAVPASGGGITVSGSLPTLMVVGGFYSATYSAAGGTGPYSWSATGLPTGQTINASTGVVSGTPTAAGSFSPVITATDSLSATGTSPPQTVTVIAVPAYNYDFPNPRGKPWPWSVRIGWTWQTPLGLYSAASSGNASSKFISYAVLAPPMSSVNASKIVSYAVLQLLPYYAQRVTALPPPGKPGRWHFIYRIEQGPSPGLQAAPIYPMFGRSMPDRFPPRRRPGESYGTPLCLLSPPVRPVGAQSFPDSLRARRRRPMDLYGTPSTLNPGVATTDSGYVYLIC